MLRSSEPLYAELNSSDTTLGIPSLIHISNVCRHWRDIVLSDPALWSTIHVSLKNPSVETLHQMNCFVDICLERSKEMPLTCVVYVKGLLDMQLLRPLMRALALHQKRWEKITIVLKRHSGTIILDEADYTPFPDIPLRVDDLRRLKTLFLKSASWFPADGLTCSSLEALHLSDVKSASDVTAWLRRVPKIQKLCLTGSLGTDPTQGSDVTIMEKLRTIDVPMSILRLLQCPALEEIILRFNNFQAHHNDLPHFRDFICRNVSPLRALSILSISLWMSMSVFPEYLMLVPKITSLSLDCMSRRSYAFKFLKLLSERATNGDTETFRVLPTLEHLKLIRFNAPYGQFVDMIATRWWRIRERKLKSITLSHCSGMASDFPKFHIGDDPAELPSEWNEVKQIVGEGLQLQILFEVRLLLIFVLSVKQNKTLMIELVRVTLIVSARYPTHVMIAKGKSVEFVVDSMFTNWYVFSCRSPSTRLANDNIP